MNPFLIVLIALAGLYLLMKAVPLIRTEKKTADGENPYLHPELAEKILPADMAAYAKDLPQKPARKAGFYERFVKPVLDEILSFFGLTLLSPIFLVLCIAIKIDDPGPVFFTQKRIGKDKKYFALHKFRSMKMSTPHDVPTHMLDNPEQYITRVGRILRKTSLDELPQIWDIFRGKMRVIGPRPALWNQSDLVAEREKYAANDVVPGLTGWAQINGRDELEIEEKAKLDGEYVRRIGFFFDIRCFIGTIFSVARSEGVVEGGTGELQKQKDRKETEEQSVRKEQRN